VLVALLSAKEAAKVLSLAVQTLAKMRVQGGGPRYVKLGRRVCYDPIDLSEWIELNKRRNTSEMRQHVEADESAARRSVRNRKTR
jgi:predicted DNA-binding transcriptional regulator AlpA